METSGLIAPLWRALDGDPRRIDDLRGHSLRRLARRTAGVDALAVAAVSAVLLAATELAEARGAGRPHAHVSAEHVALSFGSEWHALQNGAPLGVGFAGLSRFVGCADCGWARTHGNYPGAMSRSGASERERTNPSCSDGVCRSGLAIRARMR